MKDNVYISLIKEAERAIDKGFFTKSNIKREYGAAVLTSSGKMFSAGQYSSFNHITNIHAEMAAVLVATMEGEPDITALALVCSADVSTVPICCGICLQFLSEHCQRIGKDITIIRSSLNQSLVKVQKLSEMFPEPWIG